MSENGKEQHSGIIQVKNWQVFLLLIGWLVISILQFAAVRADTTQNSRDIEEMKRDHVTKDRFDELKEDILRRLQRIEDKLDRDRAMRSLK
jgi:hypothetical protein